MVENLYCNLRAHSHWRFTEVAWPSWSQVVVWLKSDCFGSVAQLLDFSVFRLQFQSYWTNQPYRSGMSVYNDIYFTLQWWCKQGERQILQDISLWQRAGRTSQCEHCPKSPGMAMKKPQSTNMVFKKGIRWEIFLIHPKYLLASPCCVWVIEKMHHDVNGLVDTFTDKSITYASREESPPTAWAISWQWNAGTRLRWRHGYKG